MSYICTKKLSLAGKRYYPGDAIPDEAFIDSKARGKLIKAGYVVEAGGEIPGRLAEVEATEDDPVISVVFSEGEESAAYTVNTEQLQAIADIMQMSAAEIADKVAQVADETVLIFILKVDSRKTVRDAIQKRLEGLNNLPTPSGSDESAASQGGISGDSEPSNNSEQ